MRSSPEHGERQYADVDPGHDQDVIRPGALEVGLDLAAEEGAPADQRGLHQRAALARPELYDVRQHAAPRRAAPQSDAAADEAGQHLDVAGARRPGQANSLRREIAGQIHGAGIAIVARHAQLGDEVQPLPVGVNAQRRFVAAFARFVFFGSACCRWSAECRPARIKHVIAEPKLLGLDIDRFLLAAVRAVADQSFANDMCGYIDSVLAGREGLQVVGDRRLRGIARLKIEAVQAESSPAILKQKAT